MIQIDATFTDNSQDFDCTLDTGQDFDCHMDGILPGDYSGSYSVTPSSTAQTLPTNGKTLQADIVINPVPSNYGLITWDGSTITVS